MARLQRKGRHVASADAMIPWPACAKTARPPCVTVYAVARRTLSRIDRGAVAVLVELDRKKSKGLNYD